MQLQANNTKLFWKADLHNYQVHTMEGIGTEPEFMDGFEYTTQEILNHFQNTQYTRKQGGWLETQK